MNIKTIYIATIIATIIVSCGKKEIPPFAHSIVEQSHSIPLSESLKHLDGFIASQQKTKGQRNYSISTVDTLRVKRLQSKAQSSIVPEGCEALLYIVNFESGGYALLSADDRITDPIISVVNNGSITAEQLYSSYNRVFCSERFSKGGVYQGSTFELYDEDKADWYIGNYTENSDTTMIATDFIDGLTVGYVVEQVGGGNMILPGTPTYGGEGDMTVEVSYTDLGTTNIVSPLLTAYTAWTQEESPYNDFTPNNYPAGCVNIALGKILAYFNGPLTITYQGITLDWYDITYNQTSYYGKMYIGLLLRFLGCVCNSWYLPFGVGTFTLPIEVASFLSDAGYSGVSYSDYSTYAVKTALNNGCPVFVSGINRIGNMIPDIAHSHAWNIDGYKEKHTMQTTRYYLNGTLVNTQTTIITTTLVSCCFGWGGSCDRYLTSGVFQFMKGGSPRNYSIYLRTITYNNPTL